MSDDGERDAFVEAAIDKAVAPYERVLPRWLLGEMRAFLADVAETHPVGSTLIDRARPRKAPDKSGDVAKAGRKDASEAEGSEGGAGSGDAAGGEGKR